MCEIQELLPKGITPGREKDQMVNENWFHKIIPFIDTVLASELFNILLKSQVFPWQERERERERNFISKSTTKKKKKSTTKLWDLSGFEMYLMFLHQINELIFNLVS